VSPLGGTPVCANTTAGARAMDAIPTDRQLPIIY
jgi:hypothetical protein